MEIDCEVVDLPVGDQLAIVRVGGGQIFRFLPYFQNYDVQVEHRAGATSELVLQLRPRVRPDLSTSSHSISTSFPLAVSLQVRSSPDRSGSVYVLLCSMSGQSPTRLFPSGPLWLTWDPLTSACFEAANTTMLQNFLGVLDSQGGATATLWLGPVASSLPALRGLILHIAPMVIGARDLDTGAPLFLEFL